MATHQSTTPALQDIGSPASFISKALLRLTPPTKPFAPDQAWTHVYHDISTHNLHALQGELTLRHEPGGHLLIESYRDCPDAYRYFTLADLHLSDNALRAPTQWHITTKVARAVHQPPYLNSGLVKQAQVEHGQYTLAIGSRRHTRPLDGLYTCKWCLLAAVGRLPQDGTRPVRFTLLDEFDQICPGQTIVWRGQTQARTRRGPIMLHCYQHTGTATMPGMFYVDEAGRILAYLAGMEFLVLKSANGEETGYLK